MDSNSISRAATSILPCCSRPRLNCSMCSPGATAGRSPDSPVCTDELTRRRRWLSFRFQLGASGNTEGGTVMTKAVRVHKVGGPEALVYEDVDVPAPGPGEVRIRQHAVGLNFIDVYFRTGLYKAPGLPFIAGNEAAG